MCRFEFSCKHAHFRRQREPEDPSDSRSPPPGNPTSSRRVISSTGNSSAFPSSSSTAQSTLSQSPPVQAKAHPQLPRKEWVTVVQGVLPYLSSNATASGEVKTTNSRTRDGAQLIAARALPELPHRKVPDVSPMGTHMPSASLASVQAAATKSSAPPPSTNLVSPRVKPLCSHALNVSKRSPLVITPLIPVLTRVALMKMGEIVIPGLICQRMFMRLPPGHQVLSREQYLHRRSPYWMKHGALQLSTSNGNFRLRNQSLQPRSGYSIPSLLSLQQPICKGHGMKS